MGMLILGLVLFLGVHSLRIVAEGSRTALIGRIGAKRWKAVYSVLSLLGLGLVVWGFGQARAQPMALWMPPYGMRHVAWLLTLLAFILIAAAYVPSNIFKARLHHPMVLGVALWALAHVLANGNLAHVVLFGSFLVWALLSFAAARARDGSSGLHDDAGRSLGTVMTVLMGTAAWAVVAFWAHGLLIGIRPV